MVPDLFSNRYLKYLSMQFSAAPAEVSKIIKYKTCSIRRNQTETLVAIAAQICLNIKSSYEITFNDWIIIVCKLKITI